MINQLFAALLLCALLGCSTSGSHDTAASQDQAAPDTTESDGELVAPLTGDHRLEAYFNENQLHQIQEYINDFNRIKTAPQLHHAFQKIQLMSGDLEETLSAAQEKTGDFSLEVNWMDTLATGITFRRHEGTSVAVRPNLSIFKHLAETTPEKSDDDFMDDFLSAYGESYFLPLWIHQTWDYGGPSLLGDGTELNVLSKIQKALASSAEFETELKGIKNEILSDITDWPCYQYDGQRIIAEIDKIVAAIRLSEQEKSRLQKRMEEFKNPSPDLNVDCEHKDCQCGG